MLPCWHPGQRHSWRSFSRPVSSPRYVFSLKAIEEHLAMGLLVTVFTCATLTTTWRFYRTIESSLNLRFENHDLVEDLQIAKNQTDALNQQLELRVQERTAELHAVHRASAG